MNIGYIRVSNDKQSKTKQIEKLEKYNIEKWFMEITSTKDNERPIFQKMIEFAREGDTIYVCDFSRIARSTAELLWLIGKMEEKKIYLFSVKEVVDTSTKIGIAKLSMINLIVEFEKTNLSEKQKEGIEIAKREGKYVGRKPVRVNKSKFEKAYFEYMSRKLTKMQFADKIGITRPTLDKLIKAYETDTISEDKGYYFIDSSKK